MSFDLAVWVEPSAVVTLTATTAKYHGLRAGDRSGLVESARVAGFYQAVIARYPDLHPAAPKPVWTTAIDVSPGHVLMTMTWSRAEEVAHVVRQLADEFDLLCFDPQAGEIHLPGGAPLLTTCDGRYLRDPDPAAIDAELGRLSTSNWFLIVQNRGGQAVQVGVGRGAGVQDGQFALEYRDGTADRRHRLVSSDAGRIATALIAFAADDRRWTDAVVPRSGADADHPAPARDAAS